MPRHFSKTAAFAVAAAFLCQLAFASAPDEETAAPNGSDQKVTTVERPRPLYLTLPESVIHAFKYPVQKIRSWFSHKHATHAAGVDKSSPMNSSVPAQGLMPDREKRQRTSMYIGMSPPPVPSDAPGPYRQNAVAADASGCGNTDGTRGSASTDSSERETRGTLLNGLSVGWCMKF